MITYKCDKCGEELDAIKMSTMQVTEATNLERYELCPECHKKFKEWIAKVGPDMAERDCDNCIHHRKNGCESWECHFERIIPATGVKSCANCGQPRNYAGQCILFKEGKCVDIHEKWKPATKEGE